jgi:F0F1-type ATP synthase membrane subunit b/b'
MEGALTMLVHAIIIAIFLYVVMKFALSQSNEKAIDRSVLIGALVLIYMILFGHGLPTHVNKNIM